ncbi:ZCHC3 protein, partial [Atractosteus spatula]|nr:ZCHC3 protein [Atractosteus spatula]
MSLRDEATYKKVSEVCAAKMETHWLKDFEVLGLATDNTRSVIVHMYDPFVDEDDVTAFLEAHTESVERPRRINGRFGYWTGKFQYTVTLKANTNYEGGYSHPPALFSLGSSRGYLYYRDQPPFCRRCFDFGHLEKDCNATECTQCHERGHMKKNCRRKLCSLCGAEDHGYKQCLWRDLTYVAAKKGMLEDAVEVEDEEEEEEPGWGRVRGRAKERRKRRGVNIPAEGEGVKTAEEGLGTRESSGGVEAAEVHSAGQLEEPAQNPKETEQETELGNEQEEEDTEASKEKAIVKRLRGDNEEQASSEGKKPKIRTGAEVIEEREDNQGREEGSQEDPEPCREEQEDSEDMEGSLPPGQPVRASGSYNQFSVMAGLREDDSPCALCLPDTPGRVEGMEVEVGEVDERGYLVPAAPGSLLGSISSSEEGMDSEGSNDPS